MSRVYGSRIFGVSRIHSLQWSPPAFFKLDKSFQVGIRPGDSFLSSAQPQHTKEETKEPIKIIKVLIKLFSHYCFFGNFHIDSRWSKIIQFVTCHPHLRKVVKYRQPLPTRSGRERDQWYLVPAHRKKHENTEMIPPNRRHTTTV